MIRAAKPSETKTLRCAIYTRKSTEDGLEQEFNSLDAQRDAGEAFIASQKHEGWECLPGRYDDGGYSGGNLDRPAMQRLMADIEAGKVDCVVVYKVDRLSRSLVDFARIMEKFDSNGVAFVSVTQQFNTASSMGRLILNVLLSFAQFERDMISERTRDKIAATRRRGKWSGGMPLLGYDVVDSKLVVLPREAEHVRQIFDLYLQHDSLLATAKEINQRGWRTKQWTTKKGTVRGGRLFEKTNLHQLLTNPTYVGQVRYRDEVHPGEHEAIIDEQRFVEVRSRLSGNGHGSHKTLRNRSGALLRGVLHCVHCERAMIHSTTTKRNRRYRYYVCSGAQKMGYASCPCPSIPAGQIESFIVDEIRSIADDSSLIDDIYSQMQFQSKQQLDTLTGERDALLQSLKSHHEELQKLSVCDGTINLLADVHTRIATAERRLAELNDKIVQHDSVTPKRSDVAGALIQFDRLWQTLNPKERGRLIELLIERIDYDGTGGTIDIRFHPTGIVSLGAQTATSESVQ